VAVFVGVGALEMGWRQGQAHDNRCAGVVKRLMLMPFSATMDLTIDGIDVSTALKVLSEIGPGFVALQKYQALLFGWGCA